MNARWAARVAKYGPVGFSPTGLAGIRAARAREMAARTHCRRGHAFTPATTIHFTVPRTDVVDLGVYNVLGRRIRTLHTGDLPAGEHSRIWDGRDDLGAEAPPGIYFVRITQGGVTESRRLVLVR